MTNSISVYEFAARIENSDAGILGLIEEQPGTMFIPEGPLRELMQRATDAYLQHLEPVVEDICNYLDAIMPEPGDEGWEEYQAIRDRDEPKLGASVEWASQPGRDHSKRAVRRPHG